MELVRLPRRACECFLCGLCPECLGMTGEELRTACAPVATTLLIKNLGFVFPSWGRGLQLLLEGVGDVMGRGPFLLPAGFGYVCPLGPPEHRDGCASGLVAARFCTGAKFENLILKREGPSCSRPFFNQEGGMGANNFKTLPEN